MENKQAETERYKIVLAVFQHFKLSFLYRKTLDKYFAKYTWVINKALSYYEVILW